MKIALGADHRGFAAKERVKALLQQGGHIVEDFGCENAKSCDYPDAALPAATAVVDRSCELGILFCGTGIGMSIAANKVAGIRAALCHDELTTEMARRHNNANILCLPADLIGDSLIQRMVNVWLTTPFEGGRHERRIEKITQIERRKGGPDLRAAGA